MEVNVCDGEKASEFDEPVQVDLTVVILALNEDVNLPSCLHSLRGLSCPVVVVDSGSTDNTQRIALESGATVLEHPFISHAEQWRWALQHLPRPATWVLGLDADQELSRELCNEIRQLFSVDATRVGQLDGLYLSRRQIFRGRWVRHGGYYPKYLLKLFRLSAVSLSSDDLVDHHFYVKGPTDRLRYDLIERNRKEDDIGFWLTKHIRYARLQALEEFRCRLDETGYPILPAPFGTPDQRVRLFKTVWQRLPLYVRSIGYFYYRFVILRGFLDGKEGAIFHFLQALWYRLLVDMYVDDLLRRPTSVAEKSPEGRLVEP